MPAVSASQERLMQAAAHTKGGYGGVPQKVGKEFVAADAAGPVKAAGIMFLTPDNETLFLKRGPGGDWPGAWCWPGGTTEGDETPEDTAKRECIEELGFLPDGEREVWTRQVRANEAPIPVDAVNPAPPLGMPVDYTTFIQRVPARFDPELNGEHTGFSWVSVTTPPEPLHPGAMIALAKLTFNELDIARAIVAGDLTSPQRYKNLSLFAIRITGTGMSYRSAHKEYVWRDPSIYLNDDFVARCNGLSVVWDHPPTSTLTTKEYAQRVIGAIMLPYIQNDEVWGIARIQDENAANEMEAAQLSTSPAVILNLKDSKKVTDQNGNAMLLEGGIDLLDHIAICAAGVWDKGGPATGIQNDNPERLDAMAETEAEKKAREDKARQDASAGEPLDKILSHLDSMSKRMDAMEMADKARRDAEESREKKDRKDRRDAEHADWMKADAAQCARDDAEEAGEAKKMQEAGETEETAADKARKDRRDRMDKRKADAAANQGESEMDRKDRERRDAQEKMVADAVRRADDAEKRADETARKLADAMASLPKRHDDDDYEGMADAQHRADSAYIANGKRAPAPMQGETTIAFRSRLARGLQSLSPAWKDINLAEMASLPAGGMAAFENAERAIYADAIVASKSADSVPEGLLMAVTRTGEGGHRITEFRGRNTFISGLKRPTMRVTAFLTANRGA